MEITEFFGNTLNCLYGIMLGLGFLYSLLLVIGHGAGDLLGDVGLDFDIDADLDLDGGIDTDSADLLDISTLAVASAITAVGALGIISRAMGVGQAGSLGISIVGGLVVGAFAQAFFVYILAPTTGSVRSADELIGAIAEVITPIPEDNLGQIAVVASGSRVTMGARTTDGTIVSRGTTVKIQRIVGGVAYVMPELGHPWV
jgi:membrane protein implicated in regulation of membrane protease activity